MAEKLGISLRRLISFSIRGRVNEMNPIFNEYIGFLNNTSKTKIRKRIGRIQKFKS